MKAAMLQASFEQSKSSFNKTQLSRISRHLCTILLLLSYLARAKMDRSPYIPYVPIYSSSGESKRTSNYLTRAINDISPYSYGI